MRGGEGRYVERSICAKQTAKEVEKFCVKVIQVYNYCFKLRLGAF